ncbi:hypothetical protein I302_108209 [Kwoniella bestiolae CBS 10118]|uniref:Amine oxidase n=1 Tax=Kwoniella bestiolae CBS 10118 TaxID=1296100 RepID=A0A1B9FWC9_9TREE|nr:hypothetical protein I302_07426 [Kwoniella bestiolae CBS 10118]OCF23075.1 hypothetical protein I302_07426 [Kwoniella bestiolae CBS 10118]
MAEVSQPLLDKEQHPTYPVARSNRTHRATWHSAILAGVIGALLSTSIHWYASSSKVAQRVQKDSIGFCPSPDALPAKAPRSNIWKNLDLQEAVHIRRWLMDPERGLNLTKADDANDSDTFIHIVEAYKPSKDLALKYLADPELTVPRYAHAVIHNGTSESITDHLIGPLPLSINTTLRPLHEIYHNHPIPLNARSTFNWAALADMTRLLFGPFEEIHRDLFNGTVEDGTLDVAGTAPMSYDGEWRRSWVQLRRAGPGAWLKGLDFYCYVDMTGTDPSQYKLLSIVHNRKVYNSTESLFTAWKAGELVRPPPAEMSNWATRLPTGKARDLDDRAGPRTVQFDGGRYRVDRKEGWISWMGWEFFTSFERDMGLHLWNINFRGERIIYELSPQEAMAQYSGYDPHQASCVWLDRAFGMGGNVREVILGYDCPADATLLDATIHEKGSSTRRNAICIFERESGRPLSRHTGFTKGEMGAVKGYELVVRSISTVGNYDYLFDYTFQLDGTIEIRLSASGYLQGGVWHEEQSNYGHKIRETAMGSLHDHVINYKVDFDVGGEVRNSFMKVGLEVEERDEDWFEDDWGKAAVQQRLVREMIEEEAMLDYAQNMEGAYVVTNEESLNRWGHPRGYALHPGPLCRLTNLKSKRTERNVEWAKHHLAVSRRKDEEPSSSSMWNINLPGKPAVDFGKLFDGESIDQEDLVVWINLGTHHIPRSEDSPNTLTNVATSYILLTPWNYNDADVSLESRNSVILNKDGNWVVQEGVKQPEHCVPRDTPPLTYGGIEGWDEDGSKRDEGGLQYRQMLGEFDRSTQYSYR